MLVCVVWESALIKEESTIIPKISVPLLCPGNELDRIGCEESKRGLSDKRIIPEYPPEVPVVSVRVPEAK